MFAWLKRKKKKQKQKTVIDYSTDRQEESGKTEFFEEIAASEEAQFIIQIRELNNPGRNWNLPVTNELMIGRAPHCAIHLFDQSVSKEQCKIIIQNKELVLVQVGTTNLTQKNGVKVMDKVVLHSGDVLKLGRVTLRIESIQSLEKNAAPVTNNVSEIDEDSTAFFF